jgi:hypothetical protein
VQQKKIRWLQHAGRPSIRKPSKSGAGSALPELANQPESCAALADAASIAPGADISAQLARLWSRPDRPTPVDGYPAWHESGSLKQAARTLLSQIVAGLVNKLLDMGRLADARTFLRSWQGDENHQPQAVLSLAEARLARINGDLVGAQVAANQALALAQNGHALTRSEFEALAHLFWELQMAPQVLQATQAARKYYPLDRDLLELLARADFVLECRSGSDACYGVHGCRARSR